MYVCMYIYSSMYIFSMCMYICIYIYVYVYIYIRYIYIYVYMHTYLYNLYIYIHIYTYKHIHIYTHISVYTYIHFINQLEAAAMEWRSKYCDLRLKAEALMNKVISISTVLCCQLAACSALRWSKQAYIYE